MPPLSRRALNRATLARQMLLDREAAEPIEALERLAGLQAQLPRPPFLALWSRVRGFQRKALSDLLLQRRAVRATLMRGTLHIVTARDFRSLRASLQPGLDRGLAAALRGRTGAIDMERLLSIACEYFSESPRTFDELRHFLATLYPQDDIRAMAYVIRLKLPLVQVPDESDWSYPSPANFAEAQSFLGKPLSSASDPRALILRYLSAFGPATPADAQTWLGLPSLQAAFEALRAKLQTFEDEKHRELFDLPDAPRPPGDAVAPVRFLPEFDSVVLAHADRTRLVRPEYRARLYRPNLVVPPTFLVDGFVEGTWALERKRKSTRLVLTPFAKLRKNDRSALSEEAESMLRFSEGDQVEINIRFAAG